MADGAWWLSAMVAVTQSPVRKDLCALGDSVAKKQTENKGNQTKIKPPQTEIVMSLRWWQPCQIESLRKFLPLLITIRRGHRGIAGAHQNDVLA